MRPLVLVTPDYEESLPPRYLLKRSYADAIVAAGGLPIVPTFGSPVAELLDAAKALVVTGGAFDIHPEAYGEERRDGCGPQKGARTRFEWDLLEGALERRLPVLGVCGGMQLLNVVRGGTLHQDLPADVPGSLPHEQTTPREEAAHGLSIEGEGWIARAAALSQTAPAVNTTHHQGVKREGRGLVVTARAPDGVVEAIEDPSLPFVVGVQWHPELMVETHPWNAAIYRQLVDAAREAR
ncbi:gamma-glutamyl-gamma-aminobutyrate hydrolase family protein [Vulgatibacter incomptus]|uniref:Glutamine amidotransferase, class I n=1 Tax=Vulgatibacter incomptus TaxID=1391653 RepID=A0A0K1PEK9_9BACT|nr:gamma-glutamyl-gamma-aminobutyrate hydrolase family protein [Vulgatibacter incomptus]AKU91937.1 Glutamine amidotransferase, class I [Vulgatibacter incomptus]